MCNRKWACLIKHLAKNSGRGSEANISIKEKEEEAGHRKHAGIRSRKARCPGSGKNPARSQDGKGVNRGEVANSGGLPQPGKTLSRSHLLTQIQRSQSSGGTDLGPAKGSLPHTWAPRILPQAKPHTSKFPYGPYCPSDFADGVSPHSTALSVCLRSRPQFLFSGKPLLFLERSTLDKLR